MTIYLIKTKNRELLKVSRQVFTEGNTFNHLKNKIFNVKPCRVSANIHKGRRNGIKEEYNVKGVLPKYGETMSNLINQKLINKLYGRIK